MGILPQSDNISNSTLSNSKIPDYAKDYKNEYLFIRGINKTCGNFQAFSLISMFVIRLNYNLKNKS